MDDKDLLTFIITAEIDYKHLVAQKVKAYSLNDALKKLNLDLRQVRDWEVK